MIFAGPWWTSLAPLEIVLVILIWFVINLLITTIFLEIALSIVDAKHTDFGEVFVTAFVITILGLLLFIWWVLTIIALILIIYFIAKRHDIGFCMAIIVAILAKIIEFLVIIVLIIVFGTLGWAIGSIFGIP